LTLYSLQSRIKYAKWTKEDIEGYNGPTMTIVAHLAETVLQDLDTDYTISESGIAGPGAGRKGAAPGYVAVGVASAKGATKTAEHKTGSDNRAENMVAFASLALDLLLECLRE